MSNSESFQAAHRMAKLIHVKGECYRVTFGQCLKAHNAMIKSVLERANGEQIKIDPSTILTFVNVSGMTLKGWVNYGEGKADERFSTFRQNRMHQYLTSLIQDAKSFDLVVEIDFDNGWQKSTYKIKK